jgi:hypothetical protein
MKPDTNSITMRSAANEYAHQATESGELDLRDCEFVGGGVADELLWLAEELELTILVSENSVAEMLRVIADRRHDHDVSAKLFEDLVVIAAPQ